MSEICLVCNILSGNMINISHHPKELGFKVDFVLGYQAQQNDVLCNTCFDDLQIAFNFKQKCLHSAVKINEIKQFPSSSELKVEPKSDTEEESIISTVSFNSKQNSDHTMDYHRKYFKREKSVDINDANDLELLSESTLDKDRNLKTAQN